MKRITIILKEKISKVILWKPLRLVLLILTGIVAFQYFQTKVYEFPSASAFTGPYLYNPYEDLNGEWLKANFHAHSNTWFGITDGKQSGEEMINTYQQHGYDVACLSEYHKINSSIYTSGNIPVPVYEHGMNLFKSHHLGIGSEKITLNDIMLWQNNSIKQFLLGQMKEHSPLVCINHPGLRGGHQAKDIGQLTGYECLEVLNNHRKYFAHWDAVLSAGRPVWILGNDDCHDLTREKIAFSWNLIHSNTRSADGIISSLKNGKSIAIRRNKKIANADSLLAWAKINNGDIIKEVKTTTDEVIYKLKSKAECIKLIGQNGRQVHEVRNTDSITYRFSQDDTYIRAEIETAPFNVYLNPIIRFNGKETPSNITLAHVQFFPTLLMRLSILLLYLFLVTLLFPKFIYWIFYGSKKIRHTLYEQSRS